MENTNLGLYLDIILALTYTFQSLANLCYLIIIICNPFLIYDQSVTDQLIISPDFLLIIDRTLDSCLTNFIFSTSIVFLLYQKYFHNSKLDLLGYLGLGQIIYLSLMMGLNLNIWLQISTDQTSILVDNILNFSLILGWSYSTFLFFRPQ